MEHKMVPSKANVITVFKLEINVFYFASHNHWWQVYMELNPGAQGFNYHRGLTTIYTQISLIFPHSGIELALIHAQLV